LTIIEKWVNCPKNLIYKFGTKDINMKINNNLIVLRAKSRKSYPGPWFKFGPPGNMTGNAHYSVLASYIGGDAYKVVHDHFKCVRGISHSVIVGGSVAKNLGVPDQTRWDFKAKI
jgi:hypothetical protein